MRKSILTGMFMCAATVATVGTSGLAHMNVKADIEAPTPNLQMLQATDVNYKQRIMALQSHRHTSNVKRTQLASLRTQDANVESQIISIQAKQQSEAAASSAAASSAAASSSAASSAASEQAASSAAASSQAAAQSAAASSAASTQAAATSSKATATASAPDQSSSASSSSSSSASSSSSNDSGLNMNQTSGTVDINALGAYLANHKGIYSAEKWARIIYRESNGHVDAQNSSGAYGVLQLLGHGEYRGMTLGAQLQMIMPLPASAWAETNY